MNENNTKISNIQKSSKAAYIIAKITKVFVIAMAVVSFLAGALLIGLRGRLNEEFYREVENGSILPDNFFTGIDSELAVNLMKDGYFAETAGAYAMAGSAIMICLAIIMHFIGKVFMEIKDSYSPFRPEIVKNLKITFVLITILALRSSLLIGAVIGFSLWCVIHIFEYGCELQKQSDETL